MMMRLWRFCRWCLDRKGGLPKKFVFFWTGKMVLGFGMDNINQLLSIAALCLQDVSAVLILMCWMF